MYSLAIQCGQPSKTRETNYTNITRKRIDFSQGCKTSDPFSYFSCVSLCVQFCIALKYFITP